MASGIPREHKLDYDDPLPSNKTARLKPAFGILPVHYLFGAIVIVLFAFVHQPFRWLFSGAPLLTYLLLLGASNSRRSLAFLPLWPLVAGINLSYAVAATSWLLYWAFVVTCYPVVGFVCLTQFDSVARVARKQLRRVLKELQFTRDVIAFFDLPALEIDVDVEGLMCIRGVTISLSTMTVIAHGVEVAIKFSDDMEVAIVVDTVNIKLFRRIDVSHVYANVKGGEYEMTFGQLADKTKDADGHSLMVTDTPMLVAAAQSGDTSDVPFAPMTEEMTDGKAPKDVPIKQGFKATKQLSPDDERAAGEYVRILDWIEETSAITTATQKAKRKVERKEDVSNDLLDDDKDLRAAVCSDLHDQPSIPHPAKRSIRVSKIKSLDRYGIRKFLHRLPMLLRAQLMPISYFHPVFIESITAGASGAWVESLLAEQVFKNRPEDDSAIKNLRKRVSAWLSGANFVFETTKITAVGYVPFNTQYDILSTLTFDDMMAYRTLPASVDLARIVRVGGADARITVPSFLLPHHEHLIPPKPTAEDEARQQEAVELADGGPKTVQAAHALEQTRKDETSITVSTHLRLPTFFDQSLLEFIAALIKATKMIEVDGDERARFADREIHGLKELTRALRTEVKNGVQRAAIDAAANDRWIAKLVGKVTRKLETMRGDVGYSGDVPVALGPYRAGAGVAAKLLA